MSSLISSLETELETGIQQSKTLKFLDQLLLLPQEMKTMIKKRGINTPDGEGNTLLHGAVFDKKYRNIVKSLLNNGADVCVQDKEGNTPLHIAAISNSIVMDNLKLLCAKGGDVNVQNNRKQTPLHMAIEAVCSYIPAIDLLFDDASKLTALATVKMEICSVATFLLSKNANPNIQDNEGCTPLHLVAKISNSKISTELIKRLVNNQSHKANLECKDNHGKTPLHIAAALGQVEMVRLLLEKKAKVDARDEGGNTPLYGAVGYEDEKKACEIVKLLLDGKADINTVNSKNGTPLHFAVLKGHLKVIKLLLGRRAMVNVASEAGKTPLDLLIQHGKIVKGVKVEIMELLLEKEATLGVTHDNKTMTALLELTGIAVEKGCQKVVDFLKQLAFDLTNSLSEAADHSTVEEEMSQFEVTRIGEPPLSTMIGSSVEGLAHTDGPLFLR